MSFNKISFVGKIIDKIIPDENEALAAKTIMLDLEQKGALVEFDRELAVHIEKEVSQRIENTRSPAIQSLWRPIAGWVCVAGLAYTPLTALATWILTTVSWVFSINFLDFPMPPQIDVGALAVLLGGLLGVAGLRTYERTKRHGGR